MSLSTKYRPKSFAEVVGQQPIISILSRHVATKTWKHVYLFDGCHGCGKTTVARILASEINGGRGAPIEIDAASNNGVENIRALISDAMQSALDCDYKVYIIDECHQMTKAAWDAALKLIEEPPSGTVFIFCTTNPQKLPKTIMSRVQRFTFKKVAKSEISAKLAYILNEEFPQATYEIAALDRIAVLSSGHVRDAIQFLDKCLSCTTELTLSNVETILGLASFEMIVEAINALLAGNVTVYMTQLQKFSDSGFSMTSIFDSFIDFVLDSAIFAKTGDLSLTNISADFKDRIVTTSSIFELLKRLIELRPYVDADSAQALLKAICLEFSEVSNGL